MEAARRLALSIKGIRVNIVLFIDSLHSIAAGSERQIYKLAEGLVAARHQVRLILARHSSFTRTQATTLFPCPIECINIGSMASIDTFKKMLHLRKRLTKEGVDVVHAYFPDACLLAPFFLKTNRNRIITSRRDMGLIYQGKPAWLYRNLRHRTDAVISNSVAVSELVAQQEHLKPLQNKVIYNGLEDFEAKQESERFFKHEDTIKLILVANVKTVKRTLDAVKAVHQLLSQGHLLELVLVGEKQDISYVNDIECFIEKQNIGSCVRLVGSISEPRRILSQAHIGLLVSESEGLSNAIMEYMQAGLPVIATNVGGNAELVKDKVNGLLIEKGNMAQLAQAILLLSQNAELRQTLGNTGKKRILEEFSIAALIAQHEEIYQNNSRASQ